ncbi:MAG: glycosyltransferase family 39 protein, partial [Verrucomicrobia bacterium]|nr:glycosyltransferase family 39 protein [Verrucomicrobiota bacterium]
MTFFEKWLLYFLLLSGVLVRLVQFLYCRSLWVDEGFLAINIVNRSYLGLLQPLAYSQAAPIGVLWTTRLAVELFGPSEMALRAYAFLCGTASLPLFFALARRLYGAKTALWALALFSFMPSLISYSNEAKQYAGDVWWTILILYFTVWVDDYSKLNRLAV